MHQWFEVTIFCLTLSVSDISWVLLTLLISMDAVRMHFLQDCINSCKNVFLTLLLKKEPHVEGEKYEEKKKAGPFFSYSWNQKQWNVWFDLLDLFYTSDWKCVHDLHKVTFLTCDGSCN